MWLSLLVCVGSNFVQSNLFQHKSMIISMNIIYLDSNLLLWWSPICIQTTIIFSVITDYNSPSAQYSKSRGSALMGISPSLCANTSSWMIFSIITDYNSPSVRYTNSWGSAMMGISPSLCANNSSRVIFSVITDYNSPSVRYSNSRGSALMGISPSLCANTSYWILQITTHPQFGTRIVAGRPWWGWARVCVLTLHPEWWTCCCRWIPSLWPWSVPTQYTFCFKIPT